LTLRWKTWFFACTLLVLGAFLAWKSPREQAVELETIAVTDLIDAVRSPDFAASLVKQVREHASDWPADEQQGPVEIDLRSGGRRIGAIWVDGPWESAIPAAIEQSFGKATASEQTSVDAIVITLSHGYRAVDLDSDTRQTGDTRQIGNVHRGIRGIELSYGNAIERLSPTEMIARNLSFKGAEAQFLNRVRWTDAFAEVIARRLSRAGEEPVNARLFEAEQVFVRFNDRLEIIPIVRGNKIVEPAEVTQKNVAALAQRMGDWMFGQLDADGRMQYKYWPSRGEYSTSNNMIRQLMATICLQRVAADRGSDELMKRATKNLQYNLDQFFHTEGKLGLIEYNGKVKLGAVALAARAILENPQRSTWAAEETALRALTDHLWRTDGRFKTFYKPVGKGGNENFYPGETLLYWSGRYADRPSAQRLGQIIQSYSFYRRWHLENRNPAFIPWHTQAYYETWGETHDHRLQASIFEMNDWLVGVQEWDAAVYPDTRGRFYDQSRRHFGPPHASATGVYLEGLIDAFRLAQEVHDADREERYRIAICRGLRSVMQLEFADDIDMFYISKKGRTRGGIRTTVYHNEIRVDNVQHNLMAILKILATFEPGDYRLE